MSDYLNSLTTRSFTPSGDVRPRLPSRFEGTPVSDEALPVEALEQVAFVTRPPETRQPPPTPPQPPIIPEAPRVEPAIRSQQQTTPPSEIQPRAFPMQQKPQAQPFEKIAPALIPDPSPSGRWEQHERQPSEVPLPQGEGARTKFARVRASRTSQELSHSEEPPHPIQPKIPTPETSSTRVERESSGDEQRPVRPAPIPVSPRVITKVEATQDQTVTPQLKPAKQETVVRVSIGRIEVRAQTPPPKVTAQRQPTPPLRPAVSLSDYLKRRDGGKS